MSDGMMPKSGWCMAPEGARPQHERCRAPICGCVCHRPKRIAKPRRKKQVSPNA